MTGLETIGVSVEDVTGFDDLVCLCGEEEVSDPVSREPGVESVDSSPAPVSDFSLVDGLS
ncbi:15811_t:CDS:2 [Funneliformis caledonium]|uniref:15811_t:CDS:1 n=1 Tax=Funneliformis caledonium TaxID=1117310 RepID=A0A9N9H172_9GLOM|nr:15811_t:CDS:2 [Funneliformis caledonium]